jgi:hypothetical protein
MGQSRDGVRLRVLAVPLCALPPQLQLLQCNEDLYPEQVHGHMVKE